MNYSYFLSLQLKEDKMTKLRLKEELSFIEKIINDFVETLPTLKRITTIKDLQLKIEKIIQQLIDNNDENIQFHTNIQGNNDLPINLVHFSWFIKMVFKDILMIRETSTIEIEVIGKKENELLKSIDFLISVDHIPPVYDEVRKNTIYILSSAFASTLKGNFKIDRTNKSTITLNITI